MNGNEGNGDAGTTEQHERQRTDSLEELREEAEHRRSDLGRLARLVVLRDLREELLERGAEFGVAEHLGQHENQVHRALVDLRVDADVDALGATTTGGPGRGTATKRHMSNNTIGEAAQHKTKLLSPDRTHTIQRNHLNVVAYLAVVGNVVQISKRERDMCFLFGQIRTQSYPTKEDARCLSQICHTKD